MKIVLTHDVDSIKKPFRHIWKRRKRFSKKDIFLSLLRVKNLYNNIEEIVALEDKYGFKSTFFVPVFLFDVTEIIDILKNIQREGWEVQLHYVHENIQPEGLFRMQKEFFEEHIAKLYGSRSHMLYINKSLLDLFEKNGLIYDSSYRVESVNTYDPFIIRENLIEIPLALMDADIFGRFNFSEKRAWRYIMWKFNRAIKMGANVFVILFHQESFRMKGGRLYERLIEFFGNKNYEVTTCIDVANACTISNFRSKKAR